MDRNTENDEFLDEVNNDSVVSESDNQNQEFSDDTESPDTSEYEKKMSFKSLKNKFQSKNHQDNGKGLSNKISSRINNLDRQARLFLTIFKKIPFALLGEKMKEKKKKYARLQLQLKQARIPTSYEMYISNAIFYSVVSGLTGAILGIFTAYMLIVVIGLPDNLTNLTFGPSTAWLLNFKEIFLSLFIVVFTTITLGGMTYALFLVYPGFQASERKRSIDSHLPYAVTFMYALSKGGMNIINVFDSLSRSSNTYGEASKEVETIIREMDYFGHDLRTAISNVSEMTPSDRFQDLLHNLLTVIDSGGSISKYFQDKSDQYLKKAIDDQKGFLETLGLLAESYVTAFVAGPLFIIIMGIMMTVMGSGSILMVYAVIYAVLPIGSVMFVVMISIMAPEDFGEPAYLQTNEIFDHGIPEIPSYLEPEYDENGQLINDTKEKVEKRQCYENFVKSKQQLKYKNFLKNPLKPLFNNPLLSVSITSPVAIILLFIFITTNMNTFTTMSETIDFLDDRLVIATYIIIVPLAIFHETKSKRQKKLEGNFPDFLKKLASTVETGMTLQDSIKLMVKTDNEGLSDETRKIWRDISWGMELNDALVRFANRLKTQVVSRSLTLITKANESSGDIGEVLMVAARDASSEEEMKRERSMNMMIYIVIIYISYMVFVGVIYVISTTFLTEMAEAGEQMTSSGAQQMGMLGSFDLDKYTRIFKHSAVIQGLCSGLMAGVMGEGSVMSGLKHSIIMVTIGYFIFTLFI
ncbi:type II secretion system F family protein [Methanohalobium sp.]|uniref:type II secretion system F family protein n=1 Tax=Methanohalobium sp. TaxID=2837493 RepID=UPI0025F8CF13|nr:type II secretion system F family protein [Methanohalobium sp.]